MSNQLKSNTRPSISELAEPIPALTTPSDQVTEDTETRHPLISFNLDVDPTTGKSGKGVRNVDKLDVAILAMCNAFLDNQRKDGRTNYYALLEDGAVNITEKSIPNLCDPEVWKLLREHFASALTGRGLHRYAPDASYSVNTGSFQIGGSRHEKLANGNPQPYPRTMRLSITRHSDAVTRARINAEQGKSS